jgi:hypothetical protein
MALTMLDSAGRMEEAADTIISLRNRLQQAERRVVELEADNAKLRELCADMFACISHANEADWFYFERDKPGCGMSCVVNGEGCGLSALANRMHELGIEVES